MTDFLDSKLKEIRNRLGELRPLVDEFKRLEAAERALSGIEADGGRGSAGSGGNGRRQSPSAAGRKGSSRRRGRPRGGGTRSNQALELVRSRPGITIPELAETMQIKQNYLYRVMPSLAEQGLVHKSGRGWHARQGTDQVAAASEPAQEPTAE
jgi:hypothetical protein